MSATAFQPEPSAKAPCTRTTFLICCFTTIFCSFDEFVRAWSVTAAVLRTSRVKKILISFRASSFVRFLVQRNAKARSMPRISRRRFHAQPRPRIDECHNLVPHRAVVTQVLPFVYAGCVAARDDTLSDRTRPKAKSERLAPHLDLEIECERPLAGPARYRLAGAKKVRFGRGEKRFAGVESDVVSIEIPDGWMSSQHAELRLLERG